MSRRHHQIMHDAIVPGDVPTGGTPICVEGHNWLVIKVGGTNTGLAGTFQGRVRGVGTWGDIMVYAMSTQVGTTVLVAESLYQVRCAGLTEIRLYVSALTTGTATVVGSCIE